MENGLKKRVSNTAFTFRGYNITNLGRTPELLAHPDYGPVVRRYLDDASRICTQTTGRKVNLLGRVHRKAKTTLGTYAQDICLIVAVELAQLQILKDMFDISLGDAKLVLGYSLGELTALVATGVYSVEAVIAPILALADEAASLANDVTLGILFSRGPALDYDKIEQLCLQITNEGHGTIAISTFLSPDTCLLMGQGQTLERFQERMIGVLPEKSRLRKNRHRWPPIHTPIVRQKNISDRAAVLMEKVPGGFRRPSRRSSRASRGGPITTTSIAARSCTAGSTSHRGCGTSSTRRWPPEWKRSCTSVPSRTSFPIRSNGSPSTSPTSWTRVL